MITLLLPRLGDVADLLEAQRDVSMEGFALVAGARRGGAYVAHGRIVVNLCLQAFEDGGVYETYRRVRHVRSVYSPRSMRGGHVKLKAICTIDVFRTQLRINFLHRHIASQALRAQPVTPPHNRAAAQPHPRDPTNNPALAQSPKNPFFRIEDFCSSDPRDPRPLHLQTNPAA